MLATCSKQNICTVTYYAMFLFAYSLNAGKKTTVLSFKVIFLVVKFLKFWTIFEYIHLFKLRMTFGEMN